MEKTKFKNKAFEYSLIGYLMLLVCWNSYILTLGNLKTLISIAIQGILLFLILSKNKYAKTGIKIWAILLILSHGISFIAKLFKLFLGDDFNLLELLSKTIFLIIGILIYIANEQYVEVSKS